MTEFKSTFTEPDIRRLESLHSPSAFCELFAFATEVCLNKPPIVEAMEPSKEARVVASLGVRGLRAALDFMHESAVLGEETSGVSADDPIRYPEQFADPTNLAVMSRIEAFGEALLNEAYHCLGKEAEAQLEKFKTATTDDEQIDIVSWLHLHLYDMAGSDSNTGYEGCYHPIRLSPKIIGRFPNHTMPPSCLGVSIIAASFLHEAGCNMLHAGVMQTRAQEQAIVAARLFKMLPLWAKYIYNFELSPFIDDTLKERTGELLESTLRDDSFHVAIYAGLPSGGWLQVDPGFGSSCVLSLQESQKLDDAYENLRSLRELAPGLETSLYFPSLSVAAQMCELMIASGDASMLGSPATLQNILLDASPESVPQKLKEVAVDAFFAALRGDDFLDKVWNAFISQPTNAEDPRQADLLEEAFYATFDKFVLWRRPLSEVLGKCRRDPAYLARRIEDMRALPFMIAAWLVLDEVKQGPDIPKHSIVEVGLPATRIGAAVLNDFATYFDHKLTPSFRLSHWPSHVPVTETIPQAQSQAQQGVVQRNIHWIQTGLRYRLTDAILNSLQIPNEG